VNVCVAIFTVPVRALVEAFGATESCRSRDPVVEPPPVVIQSTVDVAVHEHAESASTCTVTLPPAAPIAVEKGDMVGAHGGAGFGVGFGAGFGAGLGAGFGAGFPGVAAACCATVYVTPAMTTWPLRSAPPVLAATLRTTVPLPFPPCPDWIASHAAFEIAVQEQPVSAETSTDNCPPAAAIVSALRLRPNRHGAGD
jgi:hypothetical protein